MKHSHRFRCPCGHEYDRTYKNRLQEYDQHYAVCPSCKKLHHMAVLDTRLVRSLTDKWPLGSMRGRRVDSVIKQMPAHVLFHIKKNKNPLLLDEAAYHYLLEEVEKQGVS
jgi:hypothetical protein